MNIIIGATSGIGKALYDKYATDGNCIGIVGPNLVGVEFMWKLLYLLTR